jgi:hypothetical protein
MKENVILILNKLSQTINEHYGFVTQEGENFGEPVINSGPCGPFADIFFHEWNKRFDEKITITFIMEIANNECYHILIRLPNGKLYDGGIGVHDVGRYDARFRIEEMKVYDRKLLDERSYGLDRKYPRYCPDFNPVILTSMIGGYLDKIEV